MKISVANNYEDRNSPKEKFIKQHATYYLRLLQN